MPLRRIFRGKNSPSARHPLREPCRAAAFCGLVCGSMYYGRNTAQPDAALRSAPGGGCGRHPRGEYPASAHETPFASCCTGTGQRGDAPAAPSAQNRQSACIRSEQTVKLSAMQSISERYTLLFRDSDSAAQRRSATETASPAMPGSGGCCEAVRGAVRPDDPDRRPDRA